MKTFLTTLAGVFAGLLLFFVGVPFLLIVIAVSSARPAPPPARTVLSLDLRRPLTDQEPQNPFANLGGSHLSVMGAAATLRRAAADDSVKALLIRLPEGGIAPADMTAIDQAAEAVRAISRSQAEAIAAVQARLAG